jgi:hypothetical protein
VGVKLTHAVWWMQRPINCESGCFHRRTRVGPAEVLIAISVLSVNHLAMQTLRRSFSIIYRHYLDLWSTLVLD